MSMTLFFLFIIKNGGIIHHPMQGSYFQSYGTFDEIINFTLNKLN